MSSITKKPQQQEVSFTSQSELEKQFSATHKDEFLYAFLRLHKQYGAITDRDHQKIGEKLGLSMKWQYAVMIKGQEVRYCFIKLLTAFEVWEQDKGSATLFQYLEWYKYFLFQLYTYKEFSFKLINSLLPEIYGYDEDTMLLAKQMRVREEKDSIAEIPSTLRKLYSFFDKASFKDCLSLRNQLTHKELLHIVISYSKLGETQRVIKGPEFIQGEEIDPTEALRRSKKAYEVFTKSCKLLGELYSEKLEEWLVNNGLRQPKKL